MGCFIFYSEHVYKQAPYQDCDSVVYQRELDKPKNIDWTQLSAYETTDMTEGGKNLHVSLVVVKSNVNL